MRDDIVDILRNATIDWDRTDIPDLCAPLTGMINCYDLRQAIKTIVELRKELNSDV